MKTFDRTSDVYLKKLCNKNNIMIDDIVMKDNLIDIPKRKYMSVIINLQSENDGGNGTHWVALLKKNSKYFYFDSYGVVPPEEIINYRKKNEKIGYSNYIVQDLDSEACGYFCVAFLHYMQNVKGNDYENYNDFINIFNDNTRTNDKQLMKYIKFAKIKL